MWISFSVYRALTSKPTPNVQQTISQPLTPTLDTATLQQVSSSLFLDSSQIPQIVATQASTAPVASTIPQATPITTPVSSPSATTIPTPTATP